MAYNALVLDDCAVSILDSALIDEEWFSDFEVPQNSEKLKRIVIEDVVFILSDRADHDSGLLVVNVGPNGIFQDATRSQARFERILRVALRQFDRNIALPLQWQPYHEGSRLSVYAEPVRRRADVRMYFDQATGTRGDLYAYTVTDGPRPLLQVVPDMPLYERAVARFEEAALAEPSDAPPVGNFGILLSEPLGVQISGTATLEEWLQRRLNKQQLEFVQKSHEQPVRLRGAAGTGKTIAMAVKCVNDMLIDAEEGNTKTFAFLTHSSALAHEVMRGIFSSLDPSGRWRSLVTPDGKKKLWIGTLYELAEARLNYSTKGLRPLSLDGQEGREYQRILIGDAIGKVLRDARMVYGVLANEQGFLSRLQSDDARAALIEELMNEFACVLDAENIRKGTAESERYLNGAREGWQMPLITTSQRATVLEIHDAYRGLLKQEKLLSMDQMIADFGRYLSTHEWEQLREEHGFDLIFVDEYHYFSRAEAMTLQSIFHPRAQKSGRWPLLMAYDLKQSTSDAALGGGMERFRNPGVGESAFVELRENYRSTPQITNFLQDLDASFPAMDLEGEYLTHFPGSNQADGDIPKLAAFETGQQLIDAIFQDASGEARDLGGRKVAVLCLNDLLFAQYRQASRIGGKYVAVTSREDLKELQYARGRCVFSMPEYVAGLQFESVYLIHADQSDLADEFLSQGARRRYVNRVYLGASRAQRRLTIASSLERGGRSEVLEGPIQNGSLIVTS